ncbi:hypothetical protein [Rhodococcus opacus]|uniref:hypothetical protein n=1 Tax=Rhodococcus opacus TaxID=37919 RepID=UPI002953EB68|nr:hypothetical protein [Rhodococcus opacus]MDV7085605.1 hypothetical protein [Rhodococcus opacus]
MSEAGWTVHAIARSESALAPVDQLHHVHAVPLDITDRRPLDRGPLASTRRQRRLADRRHPSRPAGDPNSTRPHRADTRK